ncbi:MAG: methyltransferase domain-containing protein [Anaerolineales bacterium]|nr:methyltransferase domain-containing protein [Anaerolineales bacterium]MCZ2122867.1 methyltransferase domain-containing protein [Anaerolineales bacterium]
MNAKVSWEQAVLTLRAQPEQQELVRACYYDDPLTLAAERYRLSAEWQAVLKALPQSKGQALDVGAGRGISSYALASAKWQVDALEPDSSQIVGRGAIERLAQETQLPIKTLAGFAEAVPADNNRYDLVYGRQVMHHARDLEKMCREVFRVLKPGGLFIATREHVISKRQDLAVFLNHHPLHHLYGGENAFLLREYLNSLKVAGLKIVKILQPFDSPINYFPLSQAEALRACQSPLVKRLGERFVEKLFGEDWQSPQNAFLRKIGNYFNQTPGRLYSFFARKP